MCSSCNVPSCFSSTLLLHCISDTYLFNPYRYARMYLVLSIKLLSFNKKIEATKLERGREGERLGKNMARCLENFNML